MPGTAARIHRQGRRQAGRHHADGERLPCVGAGRRHHRQGRLGVGNHKVTVTFLNDAYGGSAGADRNLHVDGITYNGADLARDTALLNRNGAVDFAFTDTGSAAAADQLFA
jgi:hypothetical protein